MRQMTNTKHHAVIIGGSSGIGLATARRLLDEGMRVTIAGRNRDRLDTALGELKGDVSAVRFDAADATEIAAFFEPLARPLRLRLAAPGHKSSRYLG
jgi:NAD(P)-dependent dehydrogenase (short-subunit alcohol dehydrogenase family)